MPSSSVDVAHKRANLSGLELFLDHRALRRGQRSVMRAGNGFSGQIVERTGQPFGSLARVHKKNRRVALANDFEQPGMDRIPDRDAPRRLRGRPRGNLLHLAQPRHIFHRNLDAQLELLGRGGVHDRHRPIAQRAGIGNFAQIKAVILSVRTLSQVEGGGSRKPALSGDRGSDRSRMGICGCSLPVSRKCMASRSNRI